MTCVESDWRDEKEKTGSPTIHTVHIVHSDATTGRRYEFGNACCIEIDWPDGALHALRWRLRHPSETAWESADEARGLQVRPHMCTESKDTRRAKTRRALPHPAAAPILGCSCRIQSPAGSLSQTISCDRYLILRCLDPFYLLLDASGTQRGGSDSDERGTGDEKAACRDSGRDVAAAVAMTLQLCLPASPPAGGNSDLYGGQ